MKVPRNAGHGNYHRFMARHRTVRGRGGTTKNLPSKRARLLMMVLISWLLSLTKVLRQH